MKSMLKILLLVLLPWLTNAQQSKVDSLNSGRCLSMSYDIVKAHGGELSVRTPLERVETPPAGRAGKEGEGAEFYYDFSLILKE